MSPFTLTYHPFPEETRGIVTSVVQYMEKLGRYRIVIDSTLDADRRRHALKHELAHIALNHLTDLTETIDDIEKAADDYADQMTDEEFSKLMTYQVGEAVLHGQI